MKKILILLLICSALLGFGQKKNDLKISLQLQPELTIHQNQYSSIVLDSYKTTTFNFGILSTVQYNLTDQLFIDLGISYIERKLNTSAVFNQAALPPPYTSLSKELAHTASLSYKTFQVPVNFGYMIMDKNKFKSFMLVGISANYLLSTKYEVSSRYSGTYTKGYWQGISLNYGFGTDFQLTKNTSLTSSLTYSVVNVVHKDDFLVFKSDEGAISLPHNFLRLSIGAKVRL